MVEAELQWEDTRDQCKKINADCDLVSINDETERDFLYFFGNDTSYVAIGSQDEGHESIWKNTDGSIFNPALFSSGEPSECCGGQDCMGLIKQNETYFLHDLPCDGKYVGYICECPSSKFYDRRNFLCSSDEKLDLVLKSSRFLLW